MAQISIEVNQEVARCGALLAISGMIVALGAGISAQQRFDEEAQMALQERASGLLLARF